MLGQRHPFEQDYPYGILDQLFRRLPLDVPGIRDLLQTLTPTASPLAVGGDLLAVLASATDDSGPLALVVDDVQWADSQSLAALAFMMRRLYCEPVLVAVTARSHGTLLRSPGETAAGLDWQALIRAAGRVQHLHLHLAGLNADETGRLATAQGARALTSAGQARLWERTEGHPLHLRSLLAQATPGQLADLSHSLPLPVSMGEIIRHALGRLPADGRRLTEALAVLDSPVPLGIAARLAGIEDAAQALGPVLDSGLVQWEPRPDQPTAPLHIHHRLQREAVYQALTPGVRRELHAAAADLVGTDAGWAHRVAAASSTDSRLAGQLAAEAEKQVLASCYARAVTLLLWAADLAPDRGGYEEYVLVAAMHLARGLQNLPKFAELCRRIEGCAPSARRDAALGCVVNFRGDLRGAETLLAEAAASAVDPVTVSVANTWLGNVCLQQADGPGATKAVATALRNAPSDRSRRFLQALRAQGTLYTDGPGPALDVLAQAHLPELASQLPQADSVLLGYRGHARVLAGQLRAGAADLATLIDRQHHDPDLQAGPNEHIILALACLLSGDWEGSLINAEQALVISEMTEQLYGSAPSRSVAAMVHALRGEWDRARECLEAAWQHVGLFPELTGLYPVVAQAVLEQALNDRPALKRSLSRIDSEAPGSVTVYQILWAPLMVDAHTAAVADLPPTAQDLERATGAVATFDQLATPAIGGTVTALTCTSHWLHGRLAAACGDTTSARSSYQQAVATHVVEEDDIPLHRAFAHHDYARLLLADDQGTDHRDAVTHLQHAHRLFTQLGAVPHAGRAARDLADIEGPVQAAPAMPCRPVSLSGNMPWPTLRARA